MTDPASPGAAAGDWPAPTLQALWPRWQAHVMWPQRCIWWHITCSKEEHHLAVGWPMQKRNKRCGVRVQLGTTSSPDLFPIPAWIVEAVIPDEEKEIKAWVKLMVVVMNATYGGSMPEKVEGAYNKAQLGCVTGLRLLKREQQLTPLPELRARLAEGRLDYAGEPMCLMEELKAEKVVPC